MAATMPPTDLLVDTRSSPDVVVVAPAGALDRRRLEALDHRLVADVRPTILDLSRCLATDTTAMASLDPARWGRTAADICIASSRLTAHRLLRRVGVHRRLSIFVHVNDAIQATVLERDGYGMGWEVA